VEHNAPQTQNDTARYRIGVIGAGRIAKLIIGAITSGKAGNCEVSAILARQTKDCPDLAAPVITDRHAFLATEPDLVIEAAGPGGLRAHGLAALEVADIWSISGMALGDDEFT
jgi:aspartate dehydrogenase